MERRKFLIGAGSAAVGASALVGSGAFSSVEANREVTVNVANDSDAYLGLEGDDKYVDDDSGDGEGELTIDLGGTGTGNGGQGFNDSAITNVEDVVTVTNQGTNDVYLTFPNGQSLDGDSRQEELTIDLIDETVTFTLNSDSLSTGTSTTIDVEVDTRDSAGGGGSDTKDIQIKAIEQSS